MAVRGMVLLAFCMLAAGPVHSAETVTYKYDARGRLVRVERSGTVNNGKTTVYTHDKANNRTKKKSCSTTTC